MRIAFVGVCLVGLPLVLNIGCQLMQKERKPNSLVPLANIAHRGNESECVENSLPAMLSAASFGVDYVELDVKLTQDRVPVLFHDDKLTRNLDCGILQNTKVSDSTYADILQHCHYSKSTNQSCEINSSLFQNFHFDSFQNSKKIITLRDTLEALNATDTGIFIELKDHIVVELLDLLAAKPYANLSKIKIISFQKNTLEELQAEIQNTAKYADLKSIELYLLTGDTHNLPNKPELWSFDGVAFTIHNTTQNDLKQITDKIDSLYPTKKKFIWTARTTKDLDFAKTLKIDGVINSIPRQFK